ncbi:uncharacterized protein LOC141665831 [Apium graveolens]|uniref:uncharacterized protein LOC141665831 n=1 Tax=Apium graveolens TaxID=4045 RepID=UPI003D7C139D
MTNDLSMWDEDLLDDLCNERDKNLIKQVPIPIRKRPDSWYWLFDDTGNFTVKSCYRQLAGEWACPDRKFWNKIWHLKLPGKVRNFIWRMCRDVLPTAANLINKQVNIVDRCLWCQTHIEDSMHILFRCTFAREVWAAVGMMELVLVVPGDTVFQVTKRVFQNANKDQGAMFGMICWALWYRRNK